MRKLFIPLLAAFIFSSCTKDPIEPPAHPVMQYKDLQNAEVKYNQLKAVDMDNDGVTDFWFSTLLVGDPVLQRDRRQFYAHSKANTNLLNDANDESPVLNKLDLISKKQDGYEWYEVSAIVLAEKIVTMTETFWQGAWKNASHKYLPVQIKRDDKLYHGWIELSFDAVEEKLVLHKAALSTEADKSVKAGY